MLPRVVGTLLNEYTTNILSMAGRLLASVVRNYVAAENLSVVARLFDSHTSNVSSCSRLFHFRQLLHGRDAFPGQEHLCCWATVTGERTGHERGVLWWPSILWWSKKITLWETLPSSRRFLFLRDHARADGYVWRSIASDSTILCALRACLIIYASRARRGQESALLEFENDPRSTNSVWLEALLKAKDTSMVEERHCSSGFCGLSPLEEAYGPSAILSAALFMDLRLSSLEQISWPTDFARVEASLTMKPPI